MVPRRLVITPGEPAGIGPDLILQSARTDDASDWLVVADPDLLAARARQLGLRIDIQTVTPEAPRQPHRADTLRVWPVPLAAPATTGRLNPANADYVLTTLRLATDACLQGQADALVTGPVQKSVINDAGIPFTGHTEFLAERCGAPLPVMLLVAGALRVALVTTHLPLRAVADAITPDRLQDILHILHHDLQQRFRIDCPRILVCGLNPHAGESGHLGREEQQVIAPVVATLRAQGLNLRGPLPADTAFTPHWLQQADAVLAMYHDQGLPTLKHAGFGEAVNITLGLPILRTSVDHGTALDLAGSGRADTGSFMAAMRLAGDLA